MRTRLMLNSTFYQLNQFYINNRHVLIPSYFLPKNVLLQFSD